MFCKNVYLWTNTKCVWECGTPFSPLIHINISQEQQRDKKRTKKKKKKRIDLKTMTGETIKTFQGVKQASKRRCCVESDSSTATTSFWSGFIPIKTVYSLWSMSTQSNTQHIFYSAPNSKKNTEKHVQHIRKYHQFCLLDLK